MRRLAIPGMFVLMAVALFLNVATAQQGGTARPGATQFQYAVKVVCAGPKGVSGQPGILVPGQYLTAINVHNPSNSSTVSFRKKVAIALPGEKAGPVSRFFDAQLKPDEALEIDCADIYAHASFSPKQILKRVLLKGFVVIESPLELDVVAVYTAGGAQVETLHTERVPARPVVPCPSLSLLLGTDHPANWFVITDPGLPLTIVPRPVTPVAASSAPSNWLTTGYQWVSASSVDDGTDQGGIDYTYRLCFCLCSDFQNASLSFTLLADNHATVFLNGNQVFATAGPPFLAFLHPSGPVSPITDQSLFKPGQNCLTVVVRNDANPSPTGLALSGSVTADGIIGICNPFIR